MRSSSFAIRCAFFNGIDSVTQTRQLMPPEKPLGSLQLHLQIGTGLPQVLCHSSQPEQTPQVVEDTSNATRQPCADNQVSPHPSSYTSHAALSQKVSCTSVPRELFSPDTHWKVGLTIWKKTPPNTLLRYRWIFLPSFLSPQPHPFLLPHLWGKMSLRSFPDLTLSDPFRSWLPNWNQQKTFPFPFCFISPSISYLDFPFFCHISGLWPYSLAISEPGF